ncbi:hypothetical protein EV356DRAFT_503250 [Viridothelium virens]|uniref:Uncharacterized protein n=1 Tax=Viridothelium virens TaxID=1048519 RepID=A0A6A6H7R1_VIRVR|nr:hypothetical protein EV356DRAFT_503250 [Viridothelium virens]
MTAVDAVGAVLITVSALRGLQTQEHRHASCRKDRVGTWRVGTRPAPRSQRNLREINYSVYCARGRDRHFPESQGCENVKAALNGDRVALNADSF